MRGEEKLRFGQHYTGRINGFKIYTSTTDTKLWDKIPDQKKSP